MGSISTKQHESFLAFQEAVDTYAITGVVDANITAQALGADPSHVIGAVFLASGGPVRLAALARDDKVFLDRVVPEFMKTATKKRAVEARVEVSNTTDLMKVSNAELAQILDDELAATR